MTKPKLIQPFNVGACPIREFTADGYNVGRCWHKLKEGKCPRHGDVREAVKRYVATGKLTDDPRRKGKR